MADGKRKWYPCEGEYFKKPKVGDNADTHVLVSRLLLRYAMMSWLLSKTYPSFRYTKPKISRNHWNNMVWLPVEHRGMVGGGLVASITTKLSMCTGIYKQPRCNDKQYSGWMDCILRHTTTRLVRKMAKGYYEEGKALMFSQKFAMGASLLEKAIELDHNGAKALLAYYLMRGREGLPADPNRATDLAADGAAKNCRLCCFILSIDCSSEVHDEIYFGDSGFNARYWYSEAMKAHMKVDDSDLAERLSKLAKAMTLLPSFTKYHAPHDLTLPEAHTIAVDLLMANLSGILSCEKDYRLGMMWWRDLREPKKAVVHLTNAANQGHPDALCNLGRMYYHGFGVEKDEEEGKRLMEQAIKAGSKSPINWGYMK